MRPQHRMLRQRLNTPVGRSASGTRHSTGMYFTEVDVTSKGAGDFKNYNVRSSDDISSGYSSAEPISSGLSRTSSMTNASKSRLKAKRSEVKFITYEGNTYLFELLNYQLSNMDKFKHEFNNDKMKSQQNKDDQMGPKLKCKLNIIKNEECPQSKEEWFEEKSSESDHKSCEIIANKKCNSSNEKADLALYANLNLNGNFHVNYSSNTDGNSHQYYLHKKGKAPQPPNKHLLKVSTTKEDKNFVVNTNISKKFHITNTMETDI